MPRKPIDPTVPALEGMVEDLCSRLEPLLELIDDPQLEGRVAEMETKIVELKRALLAAQAARG